MYSSLSLTSRPQRLIRILKQVLINIFVCILYICVRECVPQLHMSAVRARKNLSNTYQKRCALMLYLKFGRWVDPFYLIPEIRDSTWYNDGNFTIQVQPILNNRRNKNTTNLLYTDVGREFKAEARRLWLWSEKIVDETMHNVWGDVSLYSMM